MSRVGSLTRPATAQGGRDRDLREEILDRETRGAAVSRNRQNPAIARSWKGARSEASPECPISQYGAGLSVRGRSSRVACWCIVARQEGVWIEESGLAASKGDGDDAGLTCASLTHPTSTSSARAPV